MTASTADNMSRASGQQWPGFSAIDEQQEEDDHELPWGPDQRAFDNMVREYVIVFVLVLLLMVAAWLLIRRLVRRDATDWCAPPSSTSSTISPAASACGDAEEAAVRRVVLLVCSLSLSLAMTAALLLPASLGAHQLLRVWPADTAAGTTHTRWLNAWLLQGLWRHVLLLSNATLFVLLPFAYLLAESEGFSGYGRGLAARVCETVTVLCLLAALAVGAAYLLSVTLTPPPPPQQQSTSRWTDMTGAVLPGGRQLAVLHSSVSATGVLLLLLCLPRGFVRLFDAVGRLVARPRLTRYVQQQCDAARLELAVLTDKQTMLSQQHQPPPLPSLARVACHTQRDIDDAGERVEVRIARVTARLRSLERRSNASALQRNVGYPLVMICLLSLTTLAACVVVGHAIQLVIGLKTFSHSAPPQTAAASLTDIRGGESSGSDGELMRWWTACSSAGRGVLESLLSIYLLLASLVGVYSWPVVGSLTPRLADTSLCSLIGNCALLLLVSSALPLLVRTLGVTEFDLLARYGSLGWLDNWLVVLAYNVLFAGACCLTLSTSAASTMWTALVSPHSHVPLVTPPPPSPSTPSQHHHHHQSSVEEVVTAGGGVGLNWRRGHGSASTQSAIK